MKKWFFKKGVIFAALIIFLPLLNAAVKTELNIANSVPYLLQAIPNQSCAIGENLTNVFDLDEYFFDDNGDPLTYLHSDVESVSIVIDALNRVSFYPDSNFSGIRNVTFYAMDAFSNASSNLVYLDIGNDAEPPKWSSPSKNKVRIYQSSYVNFTTSWTDNLGLKNYVFSINQGAWWVNYSENFSGLQNSSLYSIQISASPLTIVYWLFCASDKNNNMNCTDLQSFNVSSLPAYPDAPSEDITGEGGGGWGGGYAAEKASRIQNFSMDISAFKISLKQGSATTRILRITNTGSTDLSFNLFVEGIKEFVFLSESAFAILPGETKDITIDFIVKGDVPPEQYFGRIIVNSSIGYEEIVVVLEINALEQAFDVDVKILDDYKIARPGEFIKANISIRNLEDVLETNLTLYIALKDMHGNIYDSSQEDFLFSVPLSLVRNLTVPIDVREGEYIFYARASDEKNLALESDIFEVGVRFKFAAFVKSSFIFLLILFLSIFTTMLFLKFKKEKEKERILSSYLMLNELKNLIKEEKFDEAIALYIRIKERYGESVSNEVLENREKLKEEIRKLTERFKTTKEKAEVEGEAGKEKERVLEKEEEKKENGEKREEKNEKESLNSKETKKKAIRKIKAEKNERLNRKK